MVPTGGGSTGSAGGVAWTRPNLLTHVQVDEPMS